MQDIFVSAFLQQTCHLQSTNLQGLEPKVHNNNIGLCEPGNTRVEYLLNHSEGYETNSLFKLMLNQWCKKLNNNHQGSVAFKHQSAKKKKKRCTCYSL